MKKDNWISILQVRSWLTWRISLQILAYYLQPEPRFASDENSPTRIRCWPEPSVLRGICRVMEHQTPLDTLFTTEQQHQTSHPRQHERAAYPSIRWYQKLFYNAQGLSRTSQL